MLNQRLSNELHKPIIKKLTKKYSSFKDNIWGANLADMQLISNYNKVVRFFYSVVDVLSKYAWAVLLKDKNGVTFVNSFQEILDYSMGKPNKTWVGKGSQFYNKSMKSCLKT